MKKVLFSILITLALTSVIMSISFRTINDYLTDVNNLSGGAISIQKVKINSAFESNMRYLKSLINKNSLEDNSDIINYRNVEDTSNAIQRLYMQNIEIINVVLFVILLSIIVLPNLTKNKKEA